MRKIVLKIFSLVLTLCMILGMSIPIYTVSAEETAVDINNYKNILEGKVPVVFASADQGSFAFNWSRSVVQGDDLDVLTEFGYTFTERLEVIDSFAPHLSMLTDEKNETSCQISTENLNHRQLFVYELDDATDIEAIEIVSGSYTLDLDVYVSESASTVFSGEPIANFSRADGAYSNDSLQMISASGVRYVGFYMDFVYQTMISEIRVYTEKPIDLSMFDNAVYGKKPVVFASADQGSFAFNWSRSVVQGDDLDVLTDYGYTFTDRSEVIDSFAPHLSMLTDEKDGTSCQISTENLNHRQFFIYDLGSTKNIKAIEIVSGSYTLDLDIYASETENTVFSGEPIANFSRADGAYSNDSLQKISASGVRYVGFYMNFVYQTTISEIRVYTEKTFEPSYGINVLSGKVPVVFASADQGSFAFNWSRSVVQGDDMDALTDFGYTFTDRLEVIDSFAPHLSMLTDEKDGTSCQISTENLNHRQLFVYELDDATDIEAIEIVSESYTGNVDVYVSETASTVFSGEPIANFSRADGAYSNDSLQMISASGVRYVGFYMNFVYQTVFSEFRIFTNPVKTYSQSGFAGDSSSFGCKVINYLGDTEVNSMDIAEGYKVTVFSGEKCTGKSLVFGRKVEDFSALDFTVASICVETTNKYIVSDVNDDTDIDVRDLVVLKKITVNLCESNLAADIDNSGKVDANDLTYMRKIILGIVSNE